VICEPCEGEGYVRGTDPQNPGALVMLPCLECNGSGVVSGCDAAGSSSPPSFVCPRCGAQSFNPNDIRERYCGRCHAFIVDEWPPSPEAYRDESFDERACDLCGKPYRGPAVYCSLECALADA
jgi:hypothetical protein